MTCKLMTENILPCHPSKEYVNFENLFGKIDFLDIL